MALTLEVISRASAPRARTICIGFRVPPSPQAFAVRFRPTETPIPGPSADAKVGPRLPLGERASPPHHTGAHPTDKPALAPACCLPEQPRLLMPLDAPARPIAAHRPPDAPNLSIGQGNGELSIQGPRPGWNSGRPYNQGPRRARPGSTQPPVQGVAGVSSAHARLGEPDGRATRRLARGRSPAGSQKYSGSADRPHPYSTTPIAPTHVSHSQGRAPRSCCRSSTTRSAHRSTHERLLASAETARPTLSACRQVESCARPAGRRRVIRWARTGAVGGF